MCRQWAFVGRPPSHNVWASHPKIHPLCCVVKIVAQREKKNRKTHIQTTRLSKNNTNTQQQHKLSLVCVKTKLATGTGDKWSAQRGPNNRYTIMQSHSYTIMQSYTYTLVQLCSWLDIVDIVELDGRIFVKLDGWIAGELNSLRGQKEKNW